MYKKLVITALTKFASITMHILHEGNISWKKTTSFHSIHKLIKSHSGMNGGRQL